LMNLSRLISKLAPLREGDTMRFALLQIVRETALVTASVGLIACCAAVHGAEDWPQLQGDAPRSGNAADVSLALPLGLIAAVPSSDALYAAPVIADGQVFVIDGSGLVQAIDAQTHEVRWTFATRGGPGNCNNVAAPAVAGPSP
jgi:hypothetical protein